MSQESSCQFPDSHTKDDMTLDWLELDAKNIGVILEDDSEDNFDIKLDKIDKYDYTPKWNNVASKLIFIQI